MHVERFIAKVQSMPFAVEKCLTNTLLLIVVPTGFQSTRTVRD